MRHLVIQGNNVIQDNIGTMTVVKILGNSFPLTSKRWYEFWSELVQEIYIKTIMNFALPNEESRPILDGRNGNNADCRLQRAGWWVIVMGYTWSVSCLWRLNTFIEAWLFRLNDLS